jgi:hypothetical protein
MRFWLEKRLAERAKRAMLWCVATARKGGTGVVPGSSVAPGKETGKEVPCV